MKTVLATPWVPHLPFHPAPFLGYGTAILAHAGSVEVMDFTAILMAPHRTELRSLLQGAWSRGFISDSLLTPLWGELEAQAEGSYASVPWGDFDAVYLTTPTWFPTVPTEAILRLHRAIQRAAPGMPVRLFSNALGSWAREDALVRQGITLVHLNDLAHPNPPPARCPSRPVAYDALPFPQYPPSGGYLFNLMPFMLKHGCPWQRCTFCGLARGWNAGLLERDPGRAAAEVQHLVKTLDPEFLVCRDNALNGRNLLGFCEQIQEIARPWISMARADLSPRELQALERSQCALLYFGLESGSDRVLRSLGKGLDVRGMSRFLKGLRAHGILAVPSIVVGSPFERAFDFRQTLRFLWEHRAEISLLNAYPYEPSPESTFTRRALGPRQATQARLKHLVAFCLDAGIPVCLGAQGAEYLSFERVNRPELTLGP